jgi:purine-binding chemotaxis protein CheW
VLKENKLQQSLVFRVGGRMCGYSLSVVIEIMRPLHLERLTGAPEFVRGLTIIRGEQMPVIDMALLLGVPAGQIRRFITLKFAGRRAAVAVDEIIGIYSLEADSDSLPPLLREAAPELLSSIRRLDNELLFVLEAGRFIPESVWEAAGQRSESA